MNLLRKGLAVATAATLALSVAACGGRDGGATQPSGSASGSAAGVKIGIAMPQKTSQNWVEAEKLFQEDCQAAGADCILQFANGGVSEQQNQIGSMITQGVKVLVIGAIDGSQLGAQLDQARAAGIKIVAYDRLLTNTKNVDYYIAYDNYNVGELQGKALLEGLEKKGPGPYQIEVFAGSPDDSNSLKFFNGAMSVLQPKIDDGTLKVSSGQVGFAQAANQGWDPKNAQNRMDSLLSASYSASTAPDGVLCPNDTLARAVLTSVGTGRPQPVVTGQDSEDESVTLVAKGVQYSTIFKDTRNLVQKAVDLAMELGQGKEDVSLKDVTMDDKQYESMEGNPVKSFLLAPQIVTKDNAAEVYKDDPTRSKLVADASK